MSERRFDPTTGEWVTFATHRQDRMFLPAAKLCPLCPPGEDGQGSSEVGDTPFDMAVFDNRFASLQPHPRQPDVGSTPLLAVQPAAGRCEVIVYSPDHHTTLARAGYDTVRMLVDVWADRYAVLGAEEHAYVLAFENKGEVIGVTLNHPHGQIYAFPDVPPRPLRELRVAAAYRGDTGRCVECDVVAAEVGGGERIVVLTEHWVAHVPFWARFPYEMRITPRAHLCSLTDLDESTRDELASVLVDVLRGLDALFGFSLPYVMGVFAAPTGANPTMAGWDGGWEDISHLHLMISPPHRSADKLKYLAGSELMGGAFVTDVAPEQAAAALRESVARAKPATVPPIVEAWSA